MPAQAVQYIRRFTTSKFEEFSVPATNVRMTHVVMRISLSAVRPMGNKIPTSKYAEGIPQLHIWKIFRFLYQAK